MLPARKTWVGKRKRSQVERKSLRVCEGAKEGEPRSMVALQTTTAGVYFIIHDSPSNPPSPPPPPPRLFSFLIHLPIYHSRIHSLSYSL